ncbi:NUDIX domain-containing protein [Parvibium lacunae]|uniref:GDP-mannose pyrophosphatase n=1 Tax=Parvibium lacunae TaxID=1888893 RepID=A0A368L3R3_9BURK|nr:NUDIX hydrolase [Parvibium lacunae]RCS58165.1 NUDIX hydrolase [Parvibium lacunae]
MDITALFDTDGFAETRISKQSVFDGVLLHVQADQALLPDGTQAVREYIEHPGAVMVIPQFTDGRLLLERQFRYPLQQMFIEFPAGKLDAGEDPLVCAQRELLEETGYQASHWQYLTAINPGISYSTETIHVYLAQGLTAGPAKLDQGEFLETFITTLPELMALLKAGKLTDVKTQIGVLWLYAGLAR